MESESTSNETRYTPGVITTEEDVTYIKQYPKHHNFVKDMHKSVIIADRNSKYPKFSKVRLRYKQREKALKLL